MGVLNRAPAPIDTDRPAAADFVRVLATWAVGAFHIWQQSWYGGAAPAHWLRNDEFLRLIRGAFDCTIVARGNQITMSGRAEEVAQLEQLLQELLFLYRQGLPLTTHDVRYLE